MESVKKNLLVLYFTSITFLSIGQVEIDQERYISLLNEGKCDIVFNEAKAIRTSEEYGKNWVIDYYMALALCCSGNTDKALDGFRYILREYPPNKKNNEIIVNSISSCRFEMANYIINNWQGGSEPSMVRGKFGYVINCNKDVEVYQFNPEFDQSELQKRIFGIDEAEKAVKYYRNYLPEGKYIIHASRRFIFITPLKQSMNSSEVKEITDQLERAYQFMVNYYSVRPPNKLITVYLMGNKKKLADVAHETHGLIIPSGDYGYSCLADLSILGNSSKRGLGTIHHELFHLIIRTDVGDIPGWLDEGIACLYEESHWEKDMLKSNKLVWRTVVLKMNNDARNPLPILRTIIDNNWNDFTPNSATTMCELAVNYAMAKHFAMYLEDKDQLQNVVEAFKNRKNVFVDTSYTNENSVMILESAMDDNMSDIQYKFDKWLKNKYRITTKRESDYIYRRIRQLHSGVKNNCPDDPRKAQLIAEYNTLSDSLNTGSSDMSDQLLQQSIKFISKAEELILECNPY